METSKWIKVISIYVLSITLLSILLYYLDLLGIDGETLHAKDHIAFYVNAFAGLLIFWGLWKCLSWGWKVSFILIPLSAIYNAVELLFINYERGSGIILSIFILIDMFILRYLLKEDVIQSFNIPTKYGKKFAWTVDVLLLIVMFSIVKDFWDDIIAAVFAIAIYLGIKTAKKYQGSLRRASS